MKHGLILSVVLGASVLTGCRQDIQFSDSIDLEFDLFRSGDQLHSPYVAGAEFQICADAARDRQLDGTSLRSSDPDNFRVGETTVSDDGDQICATAEALTSGKVEIQVVDDGDVVASAELDIRTPDRAELYAAGPLLADREGDDALTERPKMLEGGTATFQVRYFDGETRLHGQGALQVESTDELGAEAVGTVLFEDREWLRVTAGVEGEQELELATPDGVFQTLEIDVVGEDAIADVAMHGSDEREREAGDLLMVYAQAYGESDEPIYGVEYEWSLAGQGEPDQGDMFRYEFDPAEREDLVARHGDLDATVEIRAGEGYVDSSNNVGCSIGGRSGGAWALMLLAFGGLARRRRSHVGR